MLSPGGGEFAGILVGMPAAQGTVTTAAALSPGGAEALRVRGRRCDFILHPPHPHAPAAGGTLRVPVTQTEVYGRGPDRRPHIQQHPLPPVSGAPPGHPSGSVRARVSVCEFLFNWGSKKSVETGFLEASFTRIPQ